MRRRPRRLLRILLNAATAVSLVLGLATFGLWVRSHLVGDRIIGYTLERVDRRCDEYQFVSDGGSLLFQHVTWRFETSDGLQLLLDDVPEAPGWSHGSHDPEGLRPPNDRTMSKLGFYHYGDHASKPAVRVRPVRAYLGTFTFDRTVTAVPHWFVGLLFAFPALWASSRLFGRRIGRRAGRCPACGYDLRATPDRCPECGAAPAAPSA